MTHPLLTHVASRGRRVPPQVFSSFTSIAACLAFVVELQYGGRVPFFAGRAELCGGAFALSLSLARARSRGGGGHCSSSRPDGSSGRGGVFVYRWVWVVCVCVCVCMCECVRVCVRVCVRCSSRSPRRTPVVERLPANEQEYPRPRHSKERRRTEEVPPPKRRVGTSSPGVFLSLVGALASLPRRSLARRAVTTLALSGVVARRVTSGAAAGSLLLSPTFLGAAALLAWSAETLVAQGGYTPVVRSRPPLLMNATTSLCRSAKKLVASQD